jgi:hypothetical protein
VPAVRAKNYPRIALERRKHEAEIAERKRANSRERQRRFYDRRKAAEAALRELQRETNVYEATPA